MSFQPLCWSDFLASRTRVHMGICSALTSGLRQWRRAKSEHHLPIRPLTRRILHQQPQEFLFRFLIPKREVKLAENREQSREKCPRELLVSLLGPQTEQKKSKKKRNEIVNTSLVCPRDIKWNVSAHKSTKRVSAKKKNNKNRTRATNGNL